MTPVTFSARVHYLGLLWVSTALQIITTTTLRPSTRTILVIQRPRTLGGRLTISVDATVAFVQCSACDSAKHIVEVLYGTSGKRLKLRFSSALEREKWVTAIAVAVATPVYAMSIRPLTTSTCESAQPAISSKIVTRKHLKLDIPAASATVEFTRFPVRVYAANNVSDSIATCASYYATYAIAAVPHPNDQQFYLASAYNRIHQLVEHQQTRAANLTASLYTNAQGITFELNCC